MPVIVSPSDSKMILALQTGLDTNGKVIIKKRTYPRVKSTLTDEDFFAVASQLGALQAHVVDNVYRDNLLTIEAQLNNPGHFEPLFR